MIDPIRYTDPDWVDISQFYSYWRLSIATVCISYDSRVKVVPLSIWDSCTMTFTCFIQPNIFIDLLFWDRSHTIASVYVLKFLESMPDYKPTNPLSQSLPKFIFIICSLW